MPRPSPSDLDIQAERESRLDRDASRESVALKRVITDDDRREQVARNFASAFLTSTDDTVEFTDWREDAAACGDARRDARKDGGS